MNMSIKSDKWIKRMAQEHGMISPFEANQVRSVNGEKIISYGVSSYGYLKYLLMYIPPPLTPKTLTKRAL
jgi:hypothetical protein